ncbi:hypothetical protein [Gymnodinialimonas hymeniacidonis]|uniref:hypothetical protein n=1 Tax=Gymnodinialimonas hymeniacidonis TaxID=3126508 RepID=UPI0034C65E2C
MTLTPVETPFGPGEVFILKGHVRHLSLPDRVLDGIPVSVSVHDLGDMDGPAGAELSDGVTAALSLATPWLDRFEADHRIALDHLSQAGFPPDIPIVRATWQLTVAAPNKCRPEIKATHPLEISYFDGKSWVSIYLDADGNADMLLSRTQLDQIIASARVEAQRAVAAPLNHSVFGSFKPETLLTLKRKMLNGKRVAIDLYLPDTAIDRLASGDLDPFVPLVERLTELAPAVRTAALSCKADWLADLLDPLNAHLHPKLLKTFPKAQSDGIGDEAFLNSLWISRISLAPFGSGPSDADPCATWDLHALPKKADNTIFAVKTAPDGTVLSAALES